MLKVLLLDRILSLFLLIKMTSLDFEIVVLRISSIPLYFCINLMPVFFHIPGTPSILSEGSPFKAI